MINIDKFKGKTKKAEGDRFAVKVNDKPALMIELFKKDYQIYGNKLFKLNDLLILFVEVHLKFLELRKDKELHLDLHLETITNIDTIKNRFSPEPIDLFLKLDMSDLKSILNNTRKNKHEQTIEYVLLFCLLQNNNKNHLEDLTSFSNNDFDFTKYKYKDISSFLDFLTNTQSPISLVFNVSYAVFKSSLCEFWSDICQENKTFGIVIKNPRSGFASQFKFNEKIYSYIITKIISVASEEKDFREIGEFLQEKTQSENYLEY
ncbi:MAG: hypothetical protein V7K69_00090 [Nostoc sp.]|uniref:hypothetical protein n=1 Tax=Nostoc sp. TaxID=1180 RepID=UPI002FFC6A06